MKAVIDRFEGDIAVLLIADEQQLSWNVPRHHLPPNVHEGDHLEINFQLDKADRAAAEQRLRDLQRELTQGNDPSQQKFNL